MSVGPKGCLWKQLYPTILVLSAIGGPFMTDAQMCDHRRRRRIAPPVTVHIGGTLGFSGPHNVVSMHAYQGLQLLAEVVNKSQLFKTCSGNPIHVHFDIRDDKGSQDNVETLYQHMVEEGSFDAFMGPYSSSLSKIAADVTSKIDSVIMLHGAASPEVYEREMSTTNVFSVNVLATDYFEGGLRLLAARGAKTIALAQGSSLFHKALCEGAKIHAEQLGYTVLGLVSITGSDITDGIRQSIRYSPDVFVGCGHLHNAIQLAVTSRALMFNPKAMLLAQGTTDAFVDSVQAPNANYILGPTTWDRRLGQADRVFGSSEKFARLYAERWNMQPTYNAAQAAAGGIALLSAMENASAQSPPDTDKPDTHEIRQALLNLDINSFYGRLKFTPKGLRYEARGLTQQFLPLSPDHRAEERYRRLHVALLSGATAPHYPMPSWEQRELEIYPCPFGAALNRSNGLKTQCDICPKGKYRNRASLICRRCPPGRYGNTTGQEECHPCELGMDCTTMQATGKLTAAAGWFLVEGGDEREPALVTCYPPEVCLHGNQCADKQTGIFCSRCLEGYTVKGLLMHENGVCTRCPHGVWNFMSFILLLVVYQCAHRLIMSSHRCSSRSLFSIHTVILRIMFNYVQFASTTLVATGFGDRFAPGFRVFLSVFLDPFEYFMSFECLVQGSVWKSYEVLVLLGLFLVPLTLVSCLLGTLLRHLLPAMRESLQGRPLVDRQGDGAERRASEGGMPFGAKNSLGGSEGGARARGSEGTGSLTSLSSFRVSLQPDHPAQGRCEDAELADGRVQIHDHETSEGQDQLAHHWDGFVDTIRQDFTRSAVVWVFLLYPVIVRMLLIGSTCIEKDLLRLAGDLDVVCHSSKHIQWFRLSVFGLMMYGVGLPSLLFFQLYRVRHNLLDLEVRRNFGFLYNGFEGNFYYFEIVFMARKLLILLAAVIPDAYTRMIAMLSLGFIFMAIHIRFGPCDNRDFFILDRLETYNLLSLLIPCIARLFFDIRDTLSSSAFTDLLRHFVLDWIIMAVIGGVHVAFLGAAVWSLLRNVFWKHLRFMEECFPEELNALQRCVLRLAEKRWHYIKEDPDTHELDLSFLSSEERHFLHRALCDTMKCYIHAADIKVGSADAKSGGGQDQRRRFYLGFMIAALRRAYSRVERSRRGRASNYLKVLQDQQWESSCLKRSLSWFYGLQASVSGMDSDRSATPGVGSTALKQIMSSMDVSEAANRAKESIASRGVTVEELHLALMLSWADISNGKEEYFVMETRADRERVRRREVLEAKSMTWSEDDSIEKIFTEIKLRCDMPKVEESPEASDAGSEDLEEILGLQPAAKEQANRRDLAHRHDDLLVEVQELRMKVRGLERRAKARSEGGTDASPSAPSEDGSAVEWPLASPAASSMPVACEVDLEGRLNSKGKHVVAARLGGEVGLLAVATEATTDESEARMDAEAVTQPYPSPTPPSTLLPSASLRPLPYPPSAPNKRDASDFPPAPLQSPATQNGTLRLFGSQ